MNILNVLNDVVRPQLADPDKTRWGDEDLLDYGIAGQKRIVAARPELLLNSGGTSVSSIDGDSSITLSTPLTIDEGMEHVLGEYILFRAFGEDSDDDKNRARSLEHEKRFEEWLHTG